MINAIQMAKCFCQNVNAYTRTAKTKQFIKLLETKALSEGNENIRFPIDSETNAKTAEKAAKDKVWLKTKRGAITQSWFCYPLALDFAAWLSPEFKLWVFDKIFDLIQNGKTSLTPEATPAPVQSYVIHEAQQKIYEDLQVLFEAGSPYTIGNAVRTHAELVDVFGANRGFYTKAKLPSKDLAKVVVRSLLNIELSMKRYKGDEVFQKIISGNAQEQKILVVS